jgi:hypothetical protein
MKTTVHSARGQRLFAFSGDPLVEEAIEKAVEFFEFPLCHRYGLLLTGNTSTPLRSDRTLGSYGIYDGSTLFLTIESCDTKGMVELNNKEVEGG